MGASSSRGVSRATVFISLVSARREKLSREQIHMVDAYLPDFRIHERSTEQHRQVASKHWDAVFREKRSSVSRASKYSDRGDTRSDRSTKASSESRSTARSTFTQSGSKISALYDAFYNCLDEHAPELKPLFRSSLRVKGKILVHISAGMHAILASHDVADKIAELTKTHVRFGVKLEHFNSLGKALLFAMAVVSEDAWTPEVADAWRRLFAH